MNTVKVKNLVFGAGRPKICVPLVAENLTALHTQIDALAGLPFDLVELRADFLEEVENTAAVLACCKETRALLGETPILFTFRTAAEGGVHEMPSERYFALLHAVIAAGDVDLVDIELFAGDEKVRETVALAKANGVAALLCNHDFDKTPPKEEIIDRLKRMQDFGADICKIALMPQSSADVLTLLDATETMRSQYARVPLVTMSMGQRGIVSRLCGEEFGSAMTFGAAQKASAPGQIAVGDLAFVLGVLSKQ